MPAATSGASQLRRETLEKLSHDVVALLMSRADSKIPVKRAEIVKLALGEHPRSYDVVMERVKEEIKFFSVRIVTVDHPTKAVILVNVGADMYQFKTRTHEEKAEEILRLLVLSFIFMRNNCVRDNILWDYLEKLGLVKEDIHFIHSFFGNVRKIVSKVFVRQLYLDCCKVPNSDPPYFEYSFGQRAQVETSKRDLLEFVCKMYGSDDLHMFRSHLDMVVKEEEDWKSGGTLSKSQEPGPSSRKVSASQPGPSTSRTNSVSQPGPSTSRLNFISQPGPSSQSEFQPAKRPCGQSPLRSVRRPSAHLEVDDNRHRRH